MAYNEEYNPFADSSIQQATAQSFSNQPIFYEHNPFTNITTPAPATPPLQHPNIAANLSPVPPPSYQAATLAVAAQQSTGAHGTNTSTRLDFTQQADRQEHERRHAEREHALTNPAIPLKREKNFPPLPKCCPCGSCFYQNINIEIPPQFQVWVRYSYLLWIAYSITLFLNVIAGLSFLVVDKNGASTFGLSLVFLFLFVPASYICWFRPVYRAFSGFILMIKLFAAGGRKIAVGLIVMIVTCSFAMIALADSLLMMKIHGLYRRSGASLEQAQREVQSAFVNNPTVRGAAQEVVTTGINEAMRTDGNRQRPPIN